MPPLKLSKKFQFLSHLSLQLHQLLQLLQLLQKRRLQLRLLLKTRLSPDWRT